MSSLDTSVLNRVSIKRLTEAVIETAGGSVDRSSPKRWSVTLPPGLASHSNSGVDGRNHSRNTGNDSLDAIASGIEEEHTPRAESETTLVFDPSNEDPEIDDVVVRPGTPFFNSLLDLAREGESVAYVRLGASELQIHEPPIFEVVEPDARITDFEPTGADIAIVFHFHVQIESIQSYHEERFETITLDVDSGARLSGLTERLVSHFDTLSRNARPAEPVDIDDATVERRTEDGR